MVLPFAPPPTTGLNLEMASTHGPIIRGTKGKTVRWTPKYWKYLICTRAYFKQKKGTLNRGQLFFTTNIVLQLKKKFFTEHIFKQRKDTFFQANIVLQFQKKILHIAYFSSGEKVH